MPPGFRPQVLNDAFLAAANQARKKTPELTHKQKVRFPRKQTPTIVFSDGASNRLNRSVGTAPFDIDYYLIVLEIVIKNIQFRSSSPVAI
mmetsp:Transcript_23184/g.54983  ORF Transcript_23184/g.54983 Transcript_23184/m.54983 type:complete len:90 (-) Transcript_23184:554-823(-)